MKKSKIICFGKLLTTLVALSLVTSCAREISSEVYSADHVGEAQISYPGVVLSVRQVTVADKERLEENSLGIAAGGVGGALAGSAIGKGTGNAVATIGGAALGAVGGAFAEKALKSQSAHEYVVQLDRGDVMTVVQGPNPGFSVGQQVYVITSSINTKTGIQNRSRVIARH